MVQAEHGSGLGQPHEDHSPHHAVGGVHLRTHECRQQLPEQNHRQGAGQQDGEERQGSVPFAFDAGVQQA